MQGRTIAHIAYGHFDRDQRDRGAAGAEQLPLPAKQIANWRQRWLGAHLIEIKVHPIHADHNY